MAIQQNLNQPKPADLLAIEKFYKMKFNFAPNSTLSLYDGIPEHSYSLNATGQLNSLSFPYTGGIKDITPLSDLTNLEFLNLTTNKVDDVSSLSSLKNLKALFIGGNEVKKLFPLVACKKLQELIIWDNPVEDASSIGRMLNLRILYCQNIGLTDLGFISRLKKLNYVDASNNSIEDISVLENINQSMSLQLDENLIKNVSKKIAEKFHWFARKERDVRIRGRGLNTQPELVMNDNPLQFPPNSVIELGKETVINFYETAEEFGYAPLSEGRIIVVGDGSAGKSSLIERLRYDSFEEGKGQTNGIKIDHWHLHHPDGRELIFHIWDFGGQEIQHAVHKFFFTEGCLYILVLDNRKEEEPEYWLQQIESLGGSAPVLVVFNKHDENSVEIADRKFLKEKYSNIVGFYNASCKTSYGIKDFKHSLENEVIKLRTVEEQFPNNWFGIKKAIEECTSGQHYIDYNRYIEICRNNHALNENSQKLLLKYFTTIGAITWFGDTFLNFLHVLSPAWITQGVYKIITSKTTDKQLGIIGIEDFPTLLSPLDEKDYLYDEQHYGYILSMMKKFDLCYTPDDKVLLIPSAFGKVPKLEYSEFRGEDVRTYILQFKEYMPLALIHRFTAKQLPNAYDNNYWYSGIVIKDNKSNSLSMVQADKGAKRIYVRIKGEAQLGMWEHIRRELDEITSSYAKIPYDELVALDEKSESTVAYEDLLSHIKANKFIYFHSKLRADFNVGYLMGLFESKESTIEKFEKGILAIEERRTVNPEDTLPFVINILNNNSPTLNTQINTEVKIDIDIQIVNDISSNVKGDASYLLEALSDKNEALSEALKKVMLFADDAKSAKNTGDVKEKGWGRKLKNIIQTVGNAGENFKNIQDGREALKSLFHGLKDLATHFNFHDIVQTIQGYL